MCSCVRVHLNEREKGFVDLLIYSSSLRLIVNRGMSTPSCVHIPLWKVYGNYRQRCRAVVVFVCERQTVVKGRFENNLLFGRRIQ